MNIEINGDILSEIVFAELVEAREQFLTELEDKSNFIFSLNETHDKILIHKHIEALDLLIEWFKVP